MLHDGFAKRTAANLTWLEVAELHKIPKPGPFQTSGSFRSGSFRHQLDDKWISDAKGILRRNVS